MNRTRIIFTLLFWIFLSVLFEPLSELLFNDLSFETQLISWFFFLAAGTIVINLLWYWLVLRKH
jgi:hypothetical protein